MEKRNSRKAGPDRNPVKAETPEPPAPIQTGPESGAGAPALVSAPEISGPEAENLAPEIEVEETPSEIKSPRLPGESKTNLWRRAQKRKAEIANTSAVVLGLIDGLAAMILGPKARMKDYERDMIAEPLNQILSRLDFEAMEAANKWSAPIMLSLGVMAWLSRAVRDARPPEKKGPPPGPEPEAPAPGPDNGAAKGFRWEDLSAPPEAFAAMRKEGIGL